MRKLKKALKKMGLLLGGLLLLVVIIGVLFVNLSPEFGGSATKEQKLQYAKSENYEEGVFINRGGVKMKESVGSMLKLLPKFMFPDSNTSPEKNINVTAVDSTALVNYNGPSRLIWFGNSAFLPIEIAKLPKIDAVLFSHDHYDHLDYGSVQLLKDKVGVFYTPLGVGIHLAEWGVAKEQIIEMDWWEETNFQGLQFICAPAQHFSGRGLTDRGKTLWSSWVIKSDSENIFFSGDSGYGDHFKEIGKKYGPFDFAMLECGQYNEVWKEIHMMPEETAQAGVDLEAKKIMPIHWGAFKLALHSWTDPVERVTKKASELGIPTKLQFLK